MQGFSEYMPPCVPDSLFQWANMRNYLDMGRYVPPDQEGLTAGNKLAGKHPLGSRARNGSLVVRFEMPYAIWCTNCKPHETLIGQGVRFNAEKRKVGNYYSTPIYSFRMKHTQCGGWIEIRTDPQNTAYVVTEGGKKRDTGEDRLLARKEEPGEIRIRLPGEEKEGQVDDPLARLEGKVEDKRQAETATSRILELKKRQDRDWEDPYENSKRIRKTFRVERRALERAEANREAIKDKMSLGIDLVDETEEDRLRASAVDFNNRGASSVDATRNIRLRPMIESKPSSSSSSSLTKNAPTGSKHHGRHGRRPRTADLIAARKASLRDEFMGNTRAIVDPFLSSTDESVLWQPGIRRRKQNGDVPHNKPVSGMKDNGHDRKADEKSERDPTHEDSRKSAEPHKGSTAPMPVALVNYASDSD